jgi:hypothetical protein
VTYTAVDGSGNTTICTFNVVVNPVPAPALTATPQPVCATPSFNNVVAGGMGVADGIIYALQVPANGIPYTNVDWTITGGTIIGGGDNAMFVEVVWGNGPTGTIAVTVTDANGCSAVMTPVNVTIYPAPAANSVMLMACPQQPGSFFADFTLTDAEDPSAASNSSGVDVDGDGQPGTSGGVTVSYHMSEFDAENNLNAIVAVPFNSNSKTIFARIVSADGCVQVRAIWLTVKDTPLAPVTENALICADDNSGTYFLSATCPNTQGPGTLQAINFDEAAAPCNFASQVPLTIQYQSQGVTFAGLGGAPWEVLNQCGIFGVSGQSTPNFYAFNVTCCTGPGSEMSFNPLASNVSFKVGSIFTGTFTITAYDDNNAVLGMVVINATAALQTVNLPYNGIERVTVVTAGLNYGVLDDLSFESGSGSCDDIVWYDAQYGGNIVGTGADFDPVASGDVNPSAAGEYTFWAQCNCPCPSLRTPATFEVIDVILSPLADIGPVCPEGEVGDILLSAQPFNPAIVYSWTGGAAAGLPDGNSTGLNPHIPGFTAGMTDGTWTVTVTATLGACTDMTTFDITIGDGGGLHWVNCPANIMVGNDVDECGAYVNWTPPTAIDDCAEPNDVTVTQTEGSGPGSLFSVAGSPHLIEYEAEDGNGNTITCSFTITVVDTQAPNAVCQDFTVSLDENGAATITAAQVDGGSYDNCDVSLDIAIDFTDLFCQHVGENFVTLTVTDDNGNSAICVATVTVVDDIAPTIECPEDIEVSNDPGICGAEVIFLDPVIDDNCGLDLAGGSPNILFVSDNGDVTEIPAALVALGYNVTTVLNDQPSNTDGNTVLQGDLSAYDLIYWHAVGYLGFGAQHNSTTTNNLEAWVQNGGNLFVTGYDVIPFDGGDELAMLLGGTFGTDFGGNNNLTVLGPGNSLTTGLFNIVGTTIFSAFDWDDLNGLTSETVDVVGDSRWALRTVPGGGQVAWISNHQYIGLSFPEWNIPGTGYYEALRNFAYNTTPLAGPGALVQTSGYSSGSVFPVGTTTNTFVVVDASGNSATCSFDITVNDVEAPSIDCASLPANVDITTSAGGESGDCAGQYDWNHPVALDNCYPEEYIVTYTNPDGTIDGPYDAYSIDNNGKPSLAGSRNFDKGVTTVTYYAVDPSGNEYSCDFTVTVTDDEDPAFVNCPQGEIFTISADPDCSTGVIWSIPVADDNCAVTSLTETSAGGPYYGNPLTPGTYNIEYTAADAAGNSATCSFTIVVVDDADPLLVCQDDMTVDTDPGVCTWTSAAGELNPLLAVDNCPGYTLTHSINAGPPVNGVVPAGTALNAGVNIITYTLSDGVNPPVTCSFTVTVIDTEAPVIAGCTEPLFNFGLTGVVGPDCTTLAQATRTITDNCDDELDAQLLLENPDGSLTLLDFNYLGNDVYNVQNITLQLGVTVYTVYATDDAGNQSSCTYQITLTDETDPVIVCPDDETVSNTTDLCGYLVSGGEYDATASDNCTLESLVNNYNGSTTLNNEVLPVGTTTIIWTATDESGNTASCSFTVTVEDDQNPVFLNCPQDETLVVSLFPANCTGGAIWSIPVADDNCPGVTVTTPMGQITPGDILTVGTYPLQYTATDAAGNTALCTFTLQVIDTEEPYIVCPGNVVVNSTDPGVCSWTAPANSLSPLLAQSNCPYVVTWSVLNPDGSTTNSPMGDSDVSGYTFQKGTSTVTYTITEPSSGESWSCSFTVTVNDTEAPVINGCDEPLFEAEFVYTTSLQGGCTFDAFGQRVITDNCDADLDVEVLFTNPDGSLTLIDFPKLPTPPYAPNSYGAPYTFELGVTTYTIYATDDAGNQSSCTYQLTLIDNTPPQIACPASETVSNTTDLCGYLVSGGEYDASASDNCTLESLVNNYNGSTTMNNEVLPVGTTTIIWTATDESGNTASCSFIVTVEDNQAPAWTIYPQGLTVECDLDNPGLVAAEIQAWLATVGGGDASDNCPGITYSNNYGDVTFSDGCGETGSATVTFTVTDASGNSTPHSVLLSIIDTQAPVITSPAKDLTVECDGDGNQTALNDWLASNGGAVAEDACGDVIWLTPVLMNTIEGCGNTAEYVYMFQARDECDNLSVNTIASFIIEDTEAPFWTVYPQDAAAECTDAAMELMDWLNSFGGGEVEDECGGASGGITVGYTDEAAFLADAGGVVSMESFENETPNVPSLNFTFTDFSVTANKSFVIRNDFPTSDGVQSLGVDPYGGYDFEMTMTFNSDINTFGINISDFGDQGANTLTFKNSAGEEFTIAMSPPGLANANNIFFGIVNSAMEFNTVIFKAVNVDDYMVFDEVYYGLGPLSQGFVYETDLIKYTPDCGLAGVYEYRFTATDPCGNATSWEASFTVTDETPPTIEAPDDLTISCVGDQQDNVTLILDWLDDYTASDECGTVTVTHDFEEGLIDYCTGEDLTVTWTAVDECGNSATASATILVTKDVTPPSLMAPAGITLDCEDISATTDPSAIIADWLDNYSVSDGCDSEPTVTHNFSSTVLDICAPETYVITVTWTAVDDCGNTSTATSTITVIPDTEAPELTVPEPLVLDCSDISETADPTATILSWINSASATDDCGVPMVSFSIHNYVLEPGEDCPQSVLISANTKCLRLTWTTPPSPLPNQVVANGVTYTYQSGAGTSGNPALYRDGTPGMCGVNFQPFTGTLTNVLGQPLCTFNQVDTGELGLDVCAGAELTVTWAAVDACGNMTIASSTITLLPDDEAPAFTNVPASLTFDCSDINETSQVTLAGWLTSVTAEDNCDTDVVITHDYTNTNLDICNGGGTTTVTWTATDACGNATTVSRTITILEDNTAPVITLPAEPLVLTCEDISETSDPTAIILDWLAEAFATDVCDTDPELTYDLDLTTLDVCEGGTITVTWTAVDACGNTSTASSTITTIPDDEEPVITPPAQPLVIDCSVLNETTDPAILIWDWLSSVTVSDNCDTDPELDNDFLPGMTDPGLITLNICEENLIEVHWTAVDACGNTGFAYSYIQVIPDTQAPEITVPDPLVLDCGDLSETADPSAQILDWLAQATASDNCDTDPELTYDFDITTLNICAPETYTITVTWTAVDHCNNSATKTSTIVVIPDTQDPTITVPAPLVLDCGDISETADPSAQILDWLASATASDNCDTDPELTYDFNMSALNICAPETYTITVTWTAIDHCNNSSTNTSTITVIPDTEDPTITVPAPLVLDCGDISETADPSAQILDWLASATASDNCDTDPELTYDFNMSALNMCAPETYTITVTWTAVDHCNNSSTKTSTIVVIPDTQDPNITVPGPLVLDCGDISETADPSAQILDWLASATASDNCDTDPELTYDFNMSALNICAPETYTITVTWTAIDHCNNSSTNTSTITVVPDTQDPVVTPPAPITLDCDDISQTNDPSATVLAWLAQATATDNCDTDPELTYDFDITTLDVCVGGTLTVTWTATDHCNNTSTATSTITVIPDTEAPTFVQCPTNLVFNNDVDVCGANVTWPIPGAVDACTADVTVVQTGGPAQGSFLEVDTKYTITYTATDVCGNTATCSFMIEVEDVQNPVVECPGNVYVSNDPGVCTAELGEELTHPTYLFDNCEYEVFHSISGATVVPYGPGLVADPQVFNLGASEVTYVVVDPSGNQSSCSFWVNVADTEAPVAVECPDDITEENDPGLCGAVIDYVVEFTDNCDTDLDLVLEKGFVSGAEFPVGTTEVQWIATDDAGNSTVCWFYVTVNDTEDPVIECPENIVVAITVDGYGEVVSGEAEIISQGPCGITLSYEAPEGTDNCPWVITTLQSGLGAGPNAYQYGGFYTETYLATDAAGNTAECSFTITVEDTQNPTLTCPNNIVVESDPTICGAAVMYTYPLGVDNCPGWFIIQVEGPGPGEVFPIGNTQVIYQITDNAGNFIQCEFKVRVVDAEAPVIVECPADEIVLTSSNGTGDCCGEVPRLTDDVVVTDNCADTDLPIIALFYDPDYTDTQATCDGEAYNVREHLISLGYQVVIIDRLEEFAQWSTALGQTNTLVLPALEGNGNFLAGMPGSVNILLKGFVESNNGRLLVMAGGSGANEAANVMNALYNYSLTEDCCYNGNTSYLNQPNALYTSFYTGPASIGHHFSTRTINGIPGVNAKSIYEMSTNSDATVAWFSKGSGEIVYFGWSFRNGGPLCADADSDFTRVLNRALLELTGEGIIVTQSPAAYSDICGDHGDEFEVVISTIDYSGNESTCTVTLTLTDDENPVVFPPAPIVLDCSDISETQDPTAAVLDWLAQAYATDNCDTEPMLTYDFNFTTLDVCVGGTLTVTWTATDDAGNSSTGTSTITVVPDTEAPELTVPAPITLDCDDISETADPAAIVLAWLAQATTTDNCDTDPTLTTSWDGSLLDICADEPYTITVTWTAMDACENTTVLSSAITVIPDVIAPELTVPAPITLDCDDISETSDPAAIIAAWLAEAGATDNCDTDPTLTSSWDGTLLDICADEPYTITVTWTAMDACENTTVLSSTITVIPDVVAPELTVPAPITLDCDDISETSDPAAIIAAWLAEAGATDNCDTDPTLTSSWDGTLLDICADEPYTITVTWTAMDACENTTVLSSAITVIPDVIAPELTVPAPITLDCDDISETSDPAAIIAAWLAEAGATDNCDTDPTLTSTWDGTLLDICADEPYTITVTWTAMDACENTTVLSSAITVIPDTEAPELFVPTALTLDCGDISETSDPAALIDAWLAEAYATDNCDTDPALSHSFNGATLDICADEAYTITVTWTAVDACENTTVLSSTITVIPDTEAPVITLPAQPLVLDCDDINETADPTATVLDWLASATASDNCDTDPELTYDFDLTQLDVCVGGTLTVTWTAVDACGNTSIASSTITVIPDTEAPAITVPNPLVLDCEDISETTDPTATVLDWLAQATATDNCDTDPALTYDFDITTLDVCVGGTLTVTWTAVDACGNTSTASSLIIVIPDTEAPEFIQCPVSFTVNNDAGKCGANVTWPIPGAEDACTASVTVEQTGGPLQGAFLVVGTIYTVQYTATDNCDNTAICEFTIEVADMQNPVAICQDVVVYLDENGEASITAADVDGGSYDNCAVDNLSVDIFEFTCDNVGENNVTLTVTDEAGNDEVCVAEVTVIDDMLPTFTCPLPSQVSGCDQLVPDLVSLVTDAADNCGVASITQNPVAGTDFGNQSGQSIIVTIYVTDVNGNVATCDVEVTIDDTVPPVFVNCPTEMIMIGNDPDECSGKLNWSIPVATDNCELESIIQISGPTVGSVVPVCQPMTVVYEAEDAVGNTSQCSFQVLVIDTQDPEVDLDIVMPGNITVQCDAVPAPFVLTNDDVNDNCTAPEDLVIQFTQTSTQDPNQFNCGHYNYTITRTWTITDETCIYGGGGNVTTHVQVITVVDTQAPTALCKNITVELDKFGQATITGLMINDGSSDNCAPAFTLTYEADPNTFDCSNLGENEVTLTVTDPCGNSATCTAIVTVVEGIAPCVPEYAVSTTCLDNATTLNDGQFAEIITVKSLAGQTWTVASSTGLFTNNSPAPPAAPIAVANGTAFTMGSADGIDNDGNGSIDEAEEMIYYTLRAKFVEGAGYTATVQNNLGTTGTISNKAYYPTPVFVDLFDPFCLTTPPFPILVEDFYGGEGTVIEVLIDGEPNNIFNAEELGEGPHTIKVTFDAGTQQNYTVINGVVVDGSDAEALADPGCIQMISTVVNVVGTPSVVACNDTIQVSLEGNCVSEITPDMILEGTYYCYDDYSVVIDYPWNTTQFDPPTQVDASHVGQTLSVQLWHAISGNMCWATIVVEDKWKPEITCPEDITIWCIQDQFDLDLTGEPVVFDCSDYTVEFNDEYEQFECSENPGIQEIITRTWFAADEYDNTNSCVQVITVIRPELDDITLPQQLLEFECTDIPNADPSNTGWPQLDGIDLIPGTLSGCKLGISYEDLVVEDCPGSYYIERTWKITDLCPEAGGLPVSITHIQYIFVNDVPPTIELIGQAWNYDPVNDWYLISANQYSNQGYIGCVATGPLPLATIDGECNDVVSVWVNTPVGSTTNGGLLPAPGLPIGQHEITYVVEDECGHVTSATFTINVVDNIAPVAICDEITDVTLSSDGLAVVNASTFDDGSYDNCCLEYFQVRRMDGDCEGNYDDFGPTVTFCCTDAGSSVMVIFQALDCYGNHNECMVSVNVNDKVPPIIISCPAPQTITCDDYLTNLAAAIANEDYSVLEQYGEPLFYDNCQLDVTYTVTENIDNCSAGTVTRSWTATDGTNVPVTCTQTITVEHVSDWVVEFPADVTVSCTDGQLPDTGEPEIFFDECELIAVSYEDQTFTVVPDACYKIERVWTIINWCVYEEFGSNLYSEANYAESNLNVDWDGDGDKDSRTFRDGYNSSGTPGVADGYISFKQVIKVTDTEDPAFEVPAIDGCIVEADCDKDLVLPFPTITDECSIEYDVDITGDFGDFNDISGDVTVPNVGVGEYEVTYAVTDNCGNTGYQTITITVEDCKKPTPLCDNGLVVEIMQTQMVTVNAEAFDEGSFDNCGPIAHFSYSSDINDTEQTFDCEDVLLGQISVQIWVTDIYGNQDYCETYILVQDNMGFCGGTPITIAGAIATEEEETVEGVTVEMNGGLLTQVTGLDGQYGFNVVAGNDYTVTPILDENAANGVTTYDMVLITRHILNVEMLDSPYKIIAADANKSGTVTTLDLVAIRKVILVVEDDFPNNTSWRFVDKDYVFPNPLNPWADPNGFPEVINYNNLQASDLEADFVAVKIGDVNGSAATSLDGQADQRTMMGDLLFHAKDMKLKAGQTYTVPFYGDDQTVFGYQFTMELGEGVELLDVTNGVAAEENFGFALLEEGALTTSWNEADARRLGSEEAIFTLVLKAKYNTTLSEELSTSSRYTMAEAYGANGELLNVQLTFGNEVAAGFELYQNIPNPFTGITRIGFRLPEATNATLTVTDAAGKVVRVVKGEYARGYNEVNLSDFGGVSGVLYYRLDTPTHSATRKMVILE